MIPVPFDFHYLQNTSKRGNTAISLSPIYGKVFGGYSREVFFSYKWSLALITIMNSLCTLKVRFKCLQRAMNLNVDIHPGVLDSLFLLSKLEASNLQKEKKS